MKTTAHVLKFAEGGRPLGATLEVLRAQYGVKATREESCYVGHVAIVLDGPARNVRRACKWLGVA